LCQYRRNRRNRCPDASGLFFVHGFISPGCNDSTYKDVAAKYKDNKDAEPMLIVKLKESKGHMKIAASDAELIALIQYVLSQK
jgi:hypothetical protein